MSTPTTPDQRDRLRAAARAATGTDDQRFRAAFTPDVALQLLDHLDQLDAEADLARALSQATGQPEDCDDDCAFCRAVRA